MSLSTSPPSGFRDFLPDSALRRARAVEAISKVYASFGFTPLSTSAVEDLEVLLGKGGGENEKLIFKIMKRGEKLEAAKAGGELADLGLRFDLTLPLARFYMRHQGQLPSPFKAFQIGPVWRAERAQKGRYREFWQCDADIIGSESPLAEVEVISAILAAFSALGLEPEVVLNDRHALLDGLRRAGVAEDGLGAACIALDKLDKAPREKVEAELGPLAGKVFALLEGSAPGPGLVAIREAVNETLGRPAVRFDPFLVRGFDYYTTTVFEFRLPGASGSVGGGGRYDRLTEKFGGKAVPACGASIGFERLMLLLEERQAGAQPGPRYCVTVFSEELRGKSLRLAARLRAAGHSVDLFPGAGKLKTQFKYADSKKAAFALVIGPEEAEKGLVKAKDMATGEERLETAEALLRSPGT